MSAETDHNRAKFDNEAERSRANLAKNSEEKSDARTKWSEDRTLMANESTYASWMSLGLASVGLVWRFMPFLESCPHSGCLALFQAFSLL